MKRAETHAVPLIIKRISCLALVLLAGVLFVHVAVAATIQVPGDYATIQEAVNNALSGDTIIVADGTYNETDIDFGGKTITLKSENGLANCIIDCQNSGRAFHFHSGETSTAVVEGFTIQNGRVVDDVGGGIYCENASSPTIRNCIVKDCKAEYLSGSGIEQVDQVQDSYAGYEFFSDSATLLAQTFMPTDNGEVASVKLNVHLESGSVVLRVKLKQGNPDGAGTEYTSDPVTVSSSGVHEFTFQAGSRLSVTTGNTYSLIVYKESGTGECAICYDPGNPYAAGAMYSSTDGGSTWTQEAFNDLYFQALPEGGGGGSEVQDTSSGSLAGQSWKIYNDDLGAQPFIPTKSGKLTKVAIYVYFIVYPSKLQIYELSGLNTVEEITNGTAPLLGESAVPFEYPSNSGYMWIYETNWNQDIYLEAGKYYALVLDNVYSGGSGPTRWYSANIGPNTGYKWRHDGTSWTNTYSPNMSYNWSFKTWILESPSLAAQTSSSAFRYLTPVSSLGQSFQPGVDGDITRLLLRTNKTAAQVVDLTVELHQGSETGAVIATGTVSVPDGENEITVNFSTTPTLTKDATYTFTVVPSVAASGLCGLAISASDVYSRGEAVHDSQRDLYFKTYMFVTDIFVNSGGGICIANSNPALVNCLITGNSCDSMGAGIFCGGVSSPTITNCTIADNSAPSGYGGGIYCLQAQPELNNTILWSNSAASGGSQICTADSSDTVTLNYCDYASGGSDVEGSGTVTPSNCINSDPVFAGAGNYRLGDASPCIDAGSDALIPGGVATDLDGNSRRIDGDEPPDGAATVDIGAYEYTIEIDPPTNFSGVGVAVNQIDWTWTDAAGAQGCLLEDTSSNTIAVIAPGQEQYIETVSGENTPATRLLYACRTAVVELTVEPAGTVTGASLPWNVGGYHAQFRYTAAELAGTEGSILKIYWQRLNPGAAADYTGVRVTVGHSTKTALSVDCAGNFDVDGSTVVRDPAAYNVVSTAAGYEWIEIPLDRTFYYNGTDNLVIDINVTSGTAAVGWSNVDVAGDFSALYGTPGGSSGLSWEKKFFLKLEVETVSSRSIAATASAYTLVHDATVDDFSLAIGVVQTDVVVTVTEPPNAYAGLTGVRVERATNDTFTQDATVLQGFSANYSLTDAGLTPGTYYYRVTYCNGDGVTSAVSAGESIEVVGPNSPPVVEITAPAGGTHADDVQVTYDIRDYDSDTAGVIAEYSTDGGSSWSVCLMGSGGDGTTPLATSPTGTAHVYVWDTVSDGVGASGPEAVQLRITPSDRDGTGTSNVVSFTVSNVTEQPPVVAITDPATGTHSGDITITYTLTDANADDCDLIVECSTDGGGSWNPCAMAPGADGVSGLSTSPAGVTHTFVWSSGIDLPGISGSVTVRIIAADGNAGTGGGAGSDTTSFMVDNTGTVTAHFTGSPVSGESPLTVQFSDLSVGDITSWLWDFGDGGTSALQSPSHVYSAAGNYTVSLTVSGPSSSDVETRSGFVNVTAGTPPPVPKPDKGDGCKCSMDRLRAPLRNVFGCFLPALLIACAYLALRKRG